MIVKNLRTGKILTLPSEYLTVHAGSPRSSIKTWESHVCITISKLDAPNFPVGSVLFVKNIAKLPDILLWVRETRNPLDEQYERDLLCTPITNLEAIEKLSNKGG